jgi:predicted PurR-regulated permease PerM
MSILVIYSLIIFVLGFITIRVGNILTQESRELAGESRLILKEAERQIGFLPEWVQDVTHDSINSLKTFAIIPQNKIFSFFSGAFNQLINLFVFILAAFYFLKDGNRFLESLSNLFPDDYKIEMDTLVRKVNKVLGDYLRGQILLVLLMSIVTWIALSILGVRFALVIAIFAGLAELVPWIGPFTAGTTAVLVAMFDGVPSLGLPPVVEGMVVASLYFLMNQLEAFLIIPQLMGRLTKLHPLVILFVALAGSHLAGIIGLILAVPIAASARILLVYFWEKAFTASPHYPATPT